MNSGYDMHHSYYIDIAGVKDGPHDLVTVMRRIRAQKISPETGIYIDDAPEAIPAREISEISSLFSNSFNDANAGANTKHAGSLLSVIAEGWHFTVEHNFITVFAGGLLLLSILFALSLTHALGLVTGGIIAWVLFVIFHNLYQIFSLRLYRGQRYSSEFINRQLAPILPNLIMTSAVLALMMAGGLFLLALPCLIVAVLYIFVPFLILDRHYSMLEAMQASRLLLKKHNYRHLVTITSLVLLHLICLILIIPIPLTLPVFAAAIAKLYEELSAA